MMQVQGEVFDNGATVTQEPNAQFKPPPAYPAEFLQALRDALAHLYDLPFKRHHPLAGWLLPSGTDTQGERLRELLVAGIAQLRPPASLPTDAPAWRRYRSLQLRYLDYERARKAADTLAMSERQARREHHEALEALATVLWERRRPTGQVTATDAPAATVATDLVATVRSLSETLSPLLAECGATFDSDLPPCLPEIAVDRVALRQALLAIVVECIERGSRRFCLTAIEQPEGVLLRLHKPDGPPVTTLAALPLARRLLSDALGTCVADAQAAAIVFTLPRRPSLVLLVDDDPDFVRLFDRCLTGAPYTVLTWKAREDAVASARAARPDFVVLDVLLPSQDGWEVLQRLKTDVHTRPIPVLVCSALANPALARTLGAAACLPKPVTPRALLAALERCRTPLAENP